VNAGRLVRLVACLTLSGVMAAGCNKLRETAIKQKKANELHALSMLYGRYVEQRQRPPAGLEDLEPLSAGDDEAAAALRAARAGEYVLLWGVDIAVVSKTKPGMRGTVLGYERGAPQAGGTVVMVDGGIQEMKPDAFARAPKGNGGPG
jgi:hypothetical protein